MSRRRPAITLAAAKDLDVMGSALARGLFKARAWALGGTGETRELPHALAEQVQAIGWRVLAEVPGREIVFGAVTKPWEADPEFRGIPASDFRAFHEPGYVKIAWTLRADAIAGDRVDVPHRDACAHNRRGGPLEVPPLLGIGLTWRRAHSPADARASQVRSGAARGGGPTREAGVSNSTPCERLLEEKGRLP